jgi:hypothetical protein
MITSTTQFSTQLKYSELPKNPLQFLRGINEIELECVVIPKRNFHVAERQDLCHTSNLDTAILQCPVCGKTFKTKQGLTQHNTIIRKYNIFRRNLYRLSKSFINEFKKTLVFLIHCQLPCHFMKTGRKAVTVACTESQFFATFGGYIHHYSNKTQIYKCIFQGPDASSELAQIFNNEYWGTKFYGEDEMTLVITNLEEEVEENPLDKKRKLLIRSSRRSRYKRGEVIIEWKPKCKKDIKGNKCEGGFLYMHFWIMKRRIK